MEGRTDGRTDGQVTDGKKNKVTFVPFGFLPPPLPPNVTDMRVTFACSCLTPPLPLNYVIVTGLCVWIGLAI